MNNIRKTTAHRCGQKPNLGSSDDKVRMPFLLLHQNIHIRPSYSDPTDFPMETTGATPEKKSGLSTALCEKISCFAVSHGQGIPLFLYFTDRLTRKYLLVYSNLCLIQFVDCGRIKEFLPLSQQFIYQQAI